MYRRLAYWTPFSIEMQKKQIHQETLHLMGAPLSDHLQMEMLVKYTIFC
jgi:hypothetical protein